MVQNIFASESRIKQAKEQSKEIMDNLKKLKKERS